MSTYAPSQWVPPNSFQPLIPLFWCKEHETIRQQTVGKGRDGISAKSKHARSRQHKPQLPVVHCTMQATPGFDSLPLECLADTVHESDWVELAAHHVIRPLVQDSDSPVADERKALRRIV